MQCRHQSDMYMLLWRHYEVICNGKPLRSDIEIFAKERYKFCFLLLSSLSLAFSVQPIFPELLNGTKFPWTVLENPKIVNFSKFELFVKKNPWDRNGDENSREVRQWKFPEKHNGTFRHIMHVLSSFLWLFASFNYTVLCLNHVWVVLQSVEIQSKL